MLYFLFTFVEWSQEIFPVAANFTGASRCAGGRAHSKAMLALAAVKFSESEERRGPEPQVTRALGQVWVWSTWFIDKPVLLPPEKFRGVGLWGLKNEIPIKLGLSYLLDELELILYASQGLTIPTASLVKHFKQSNNKIKYTKIVGILRQTWRKLYHNFLENIGKTFKKKLGKKHLSHFHLPCYW